MRAILRFKKGKSDKEYRVILAGSFGNCDGGYQVATEHGRRNGPMILGALSQPYLSMTAAKAIFDSMIAAKVRKGYKLIRTDKGTPAHYRGDEFVGCSSAELKSELKKDAKHIAAGSTRDPGYGDWIPRKK